MTHREEGGVTDCMLTVVVNLQASRSGGREVTDRAFQGVAIASGRFATGDSIAWRGKDRISHLPGVQGGLILSGRFGSR